MADSRASRVLRQHLDTERLLGVEAVPADAVALAAAAARAAEPAQAAAPPRAPARWQPPQRRGANAPAAASTPAPTPAPAPASTPAPAGPPLASLPDVPLPDRVAGDAAASLRVLDEQAVRGCTRCGLHAGRTQTVFGSGDPAAALMIVGEGPGADEDRTGQPFAGEAGEFLDKQLSAMKLSRESVYIANVVKCRPPGNRTPSPDEAAACGGYLRRQIEIVAPRVILTVGGPAAKLVLGVSQRITQVRGSWHSYDGPGGPIPVMPTFHPGYLLRAYTPENRRRVWEDLQAVMAKLDETAGK